jgi:hypothetical protein
MTKRRRDPPNKSGEYPRIRLSFLFASGCRANSAAMRWIGGDSQQKRPPETRIRDQSNRLQHHSPNQEHAKRSLETEPGISSETMKHQAPGISLKPASKTKLVLIGRNRPVSLNTSGERLGSR